MARATFNHVYGELGTFEQVQFTPLGNANQRLMDEISTTVGRDFEDFCSSYEGLQIDALANNISKLRGSFIGDVLLKGIYVTEEYASIIIQFTYDGYMEVEANINYAHDNPYWGFEFTNF